MISGFEVQIDDNALGDSTKDFYGISPEPNGLKNRTGAIYKIPTGQDGEPRLQDFQPSLRLRRL